MSNISGNFKLRVVYLVYLQLSRVDFFFCFAWSFVIKALLLTLGSKNLEMLCTWAHLLIFMLVQAVLGQSSSVVSHYSLPFEEILGQMCSWLLEICTR